MILVKSKHFIVLIIITCIWGCSHSPTNSEISEGQFGIALLENAYDANSIADFDISNSRTIDFDLGNIKGSKQYLFLLTNIGTAPITNINISVLDTINFKISPNYIEEIGPSGDASFLPLIQLTAIHGTVLEGIGKTTVMPMGLNITELLITGQTINANQQLVDIEIMPEISLFAELIDINVKDENGNEIDLDDPYIYCHTGLGAVPVWRLLNLDFTIFNTGNIDLEFRYYNTQIDSTKIISVGDSISLVFEGIGAGGDDEIRCCFYSQNTVAHYPLFNYEFISNYYIMLQLEN